MSAHARRILDGYSEARSLNPTSWTDYYWVVGIEGWTESNTQQVVFTTLPSRGSQHPDPTAAAQVIEHRIVEKINRPVGTYPDGAGGQAVTYTSNTAEAVVAVTYSSRRPFSLFIDNDSDDTSEMQYVRLPGFTRLAGQDVWYRTQDMIGRAVFNRIRQVNATGINATERTFLEIMVGSLVFFPFPLTPNAPFDYDENSIWVLSGFRLRKNRFNQDILTYRFTTKGPVRGSDDYDIPIPDLRWLEEWRVPEIDGATTNPPNPIEIRSAPEGYPGPYNQVSLLNYYALPFVS